MKNEKTNVIKKIIKYLELNEIQTLLLASHLHSSVPNHLTNEEEIIKYIFEKSLPDFFNNFRDKGKTNQIKNYEVKEENIYEELLPELIEGDFEIIGYIESFDVDDDYLDNESFDYIDDYEEELEISDIEKEDNEDRDDDLLDFISIK